MKQFDFQLPVLLLKVKKPSLFVRGFLGTLTTMTFFAPLVGIMGSLLSGSGLHFGFFIGLGIFWLLVFHLLRMFLWNTYGQEKFLFSKTEIIYEADYHWFKDGKTSIDLQYINFSIIPIGYEDEHLGLLTLTNEEKCLQSVVKIHQKQLEELLSLLENSNISDA